MYKFFFTEGYKKKAAKFFKKHPTLKTKYKKVLQLIAIDPFHELLDCKKMKGFSDVYRVRLTIHARLIIEIFIKEKKIIPLDIDTRENIY